MVYKGEGMSVAPQGSLELYLTLQRPQNVCSWFSGSSPEQLKEEIVIGSEIVACLRRVFYRFYFIIYYVRSLT